MTLDERYARWREWVGGNDDVMQRTAFAAGHNEAVRAEREACAKVCREIAILRLDIGMEPGCCAQVADMCNVAILKRSNAKCG